MTDNKLTRGILSKTARGLKGRSLSNIIFFRSDFDEFIFLHLFQMILSKK